jgi:glycosyltransferase involved in cell wall biosynthesis
MPRISAIVCALNGAGRLHQVLESLRAQTLPWADFETIVVDNGPRDETQQVVQGHAVSLPNLSYVHEDRPGLSNARNTGAFYATAPYVAYLDDRARADAGWLESLLHTFETVRPKPAAVGGRIWLNWDGEIPAWLDRRFWPLYSYLDHGDFAHFLSQGEALVGANIAFEWETLLGLGGFPTEFGGKGRCLLAGEERALLRRMWQRGLPIYYEPSAIVWRSVSKDRQTKRWFLRRVFREGASQPYLESGLERSRRYRFAHACGDFRHAIHHLAHTMCAWLRGDREGSMNNLVAALQHLGRLRSGLRLALRWDMELNLY